MTPQDLLEERDAPTTCAYNICQEASAGVHVHTRRSWCWEIQAITANSISQGVGGILFEGVCPGIAVSTIDGKTLHFIAIIPLNDAKADDQST